MKGIVMETGKRSIVVLNEKGEYVMMKTEGKGIRIGQEIEVESEKMKMKWATRRITALAASFLIFICAGAGGYAYYTPEGYVDVDINPGIELSYNRWDRVIKSLGINEEGKTVIEAAGSISNKGVGNAVKMILQAAEDEEFIMEGVENYVSIFVSGVNASENLEKAKNAIINQNKESGIQFSYNAEIGPVENYNTFKAEADKFNISPGKLNLLKKAYEESTVYEEFDDFAAAYGNSSIKDIMQTFSKGKEKGPNEGKGNIYMDEEKGNNEGGKGGKADDESGNNGKAGDESGNNGKAGDESGNNGKAGGSGKSNDSGKGNK